jgi:gamma-glutamyltranspeptidase
MGAADASGLVVSYIQSLYWEFGSGCVLPRTGVLMQNRGASFSLHSGALNQLMPGRLPFHTLNPALAVLGRTHHGLWLHGRRRPAADPRRGVHAPRHVR